MGYCIIIMFYFLMYITIKSLFLCMCIIFLLLYKYYIQIQNNILWLYSLFLSTQLYIISFRSFFFIFCFSFYFSVAFSIFTVLQTNNVKISWNYRCFCCWNKCSGSGKFMVGLCQGCQS